MATRRTCSVHAPTPPRRPWALGCAALAFLLYGGVVISEAGRPAPSPAPVVVAERSELPEITEAVPAVSVEWSAGPAHRGQASWYGRELHGNPTASGEPFDMYELTAAHRTLPLGSYARVRNLDNGRTVVVRINDRGPHARRRMIDLSYAAAREIQMVAAGSARVEVAPLGE